jgi:hypothetical protein
MAREECIIADNKRAGPLFDKGRRRRHRSCVRGQRSRQGLDALLLV